MKTEKLEQFTGLKAIALLMVFYWHSAAPKSAADLGARACELFFLLSGFLYYYNHKLRPIRPEIRQAWEYVKKKIAVFYPLHILTMLFFIPVEIAQKHLAVNSVLLGRILLSGLLLQSWSSSMDTAMAFNGLSWFLSSLLVAYFLAPFLARLLKRKNRKWFWLAVVVLVRLLLEYTQKRYSGELFGYIFFHVSPVIRTMDFFVGMMLADIYSDRPAGKLTGNVYFMTACEIVAVAGYAILSEAGSGVLLRIGYLVLAGVVILVLAYRGGLISRLLACKPLCWLGSIQFEFYILHNVSILIHRKLPMIPRIWVLDLLIPFAMTVVMCVVYRKFLKRKCEAITAAALNAAEAFILAE